VRIFEVSEVMRHASALLEADSLLSDLWVHGEVASVSRSPAGHLYFALRDGPCVLKCVMFRNMVRHLRVPFEAGQAVIAHGAVNLYEAQSTFQLIADLVQPEGIGLAYLQFELLRRRLEEEGLFAPERKRPLPAFPRRIGVATSSGGAVIHDILRVLGRRYPLAEVVLAPCSVQGEAAPREIVAALARLNAYAASRLAPDEQHRAIDVIILARGGGSPEELAAFNDEAVARAIFASAIPVVSAIGHETDYTIADLVADLRAPTPSVAAELVAPDVATLRDNVAEARRRLGAAITATVGDLRQRLAGTHQRLLWRSPVATVRQRRQETDDLVRRAHRAIRQMLALRASRLEARRLQLEALSPLTTLGRGYALCCDAATGALVTASSQVAPGQAITVQLRRGTLSAEVRAATDGPALGAGPRPLAATSENASG
jgi:exodeoxyribonuclease VII large subunit